MRAVILDLKGLETLDLTKLNDCVDELVSYSTTAASQVIERANGFDIVITNKTALTADTISTLEGTKLICVLATGTNVVDKQAARERDIPVCNCVAYGVDSVAQHVWSLILALHTNLLSYTRNISEGEWQKSDQFCFIHHPIVELKGRTLGIVGNGNLGKGVAAIANAFGMEVVICQKIGESKAAKSGELPFDQFVQEADVISLHCPLTDETENLFTLDVFKRMKPQAFLINTARGGIVNEADLAEALHKGLLAGAAVDVLTNEPPRSGNPLLDNTIPNLIVTPHIAWASEQARATIIEQTAENIQSFTQGKPIRTV